MKKALFVLLSVTLFFACSKDDNNDEPIDDQHELYQTQLVGQWMMQGGSKPSIYLYKFNADSTYMQYRLVNEEKKTITLFEQGKYQVLKYNTQMQAYQISFSSQAYRFEMPNVDEFKLGSTYKRDNTEYKIVTSAN